MRSALHRRTHFAILPVDGALQAPLDTDLSDRVGVLLDRGEHMIVLNLARLDEIDAAGIGELVRLYNVAADAHAILWIAYVQRHVLHMLEMAGVLELLSANAHTYGS